MPRYPLNANPRISSTHGQKTNMGHFGRHLGIDRVVVNVPFYAPANGRIITTGYSASLGNFIEAEILGYHWRFAHLSRIDVRVGTFAEGRQLGVTGNSGITTGPHLHYDARKLGTVWNASFSNYVDPDKVIAQAIEASRPKYPNMPKVGSTIQLLPSGGRRTFFVRGTNNIKGYITPTDNTWTYTVRFVRDNRIGIYSKSGGSKSPTDYGEVAWYYTDGRRIEGTKQL